MTTIPKPCIVCGRTTTSGSRCAEHQAGGGHLPRPCVRCGAKTTTGDACAECAPILEAERQARQTWRAGYREASWPKVRRQALDRAGGRCEGCGQKARLAIHHRVPLSAGGKNLLTNAAALCRACHGRAHRHR